MTKLLDGKASVEQDIVWGDDMRVAKIAQMSVRVESDSTVPARLIPKLMDWEHWSPFEFCGMGIVLHIPIYVARQIMRHRSMSWMEASGRYTVVPSETYIPQLLGVDDARIYKYANDVAFSAYEGLLATGVPKEVARGVLPLCTYTTLAMQGNLRDWIHYLRQRLGKGAQPETKEVSQAILNNILEPNFPITAKAFREVVLRT